VPSTAAALRRLGSVLPADFRIVEPDAQAAARAAAVESVGFVHRRAGAVDYYFVANVSANAQPLRVAFAVGHRTPERWDPETGEVQSPLVHEHVTSAGRGFTEVELHLAPFESCFVVFGNANERPLVTSARWPGRLQLTRRGSKVELGGVLPANGDYRVRLASGRERVVTVADLPSAIEVAGPWSLRLGDTPPVTLPRLVSWDTLEQGRGYSGWARYEADVEVGAWPADVEWALDLGTVHETAQASLNGQDLGAAWKGLRRVRCGSALRPGSNRVVVEVANLWIHHMAARPTPDWRDVEETYGIRWGRYGEVKPEKMPPAGLLGPVRLVPLRRVRVSL
jgi:hypothetical protein